MMGDTVQLLDLQEKKVLSKRKEFFIGTTSWVNIFNYNLDKINSLELLKIHTMVE